jgi:hypothetical protein
MQGLIGLVSLPHSDVEIAEDKERSSENHKVEYSSAPTHSFLCIGLFSVSSLVLVTRFASEKACAAEMQTCISTRESSG